MAGHLATVESGGLLAFQTMSVVIPGVAGFGFGFVKACVQDDFGMPLPGDDTQCPDGGADRRTQLARFAVAAHMMPAPKCACKAQPKPR